MLIRNLKSQKALCRAFSSLCLTPSSTRIVHGQSAANLTSKSFSTISGSSFGANNINTSGLRAYPQYTVYEQETLMSVKLMPQHFKLLKNNTILSVDNTRKGRILLEFAPRGADGKYAWNEAVRFGLNVEEVGLLVNQLPHYKVEYSRLPSATNRTGDADEDFQGGAISTDSPEKVLTVEPGELGAINFTIDFVKDGVGGQSGFGDEGKVR